MNVFEVISSETARPTRRRPASETKEWGNGSQNSHQAIRSDGRCAGRRWSVSLALAQGSGPIKVGILHSLSGTMAISETSLKDVALMTIEEINAKGGVMGRKAGTGGGRPRVQLAAVCREGPRPDRPGQGVGGVRLLDLVSRKSVLPVFKELNSLLFYPVQYEGEELEKNVFYTGAAPISKPSRPWNT